MHNSVSEAAYFMLLVRPYLKDVKVFEDCNTNFIIIKENNTIKTIVVIKWLDENNKPPKALLYYDFINGMTNEEDFTLFCKISRLVYC
jgi:hypothetical protein